MIFGDMKGKGSSVYKMRVGYNWSSKGVTGMLPMLGAQGFGKADRGKSIILLSLVVRKVHWLLVYMGSIGRTSCISS